MEFIAKRDFSKLIAQSGAMFQIIKEFKKEDFFGTSPPSIFIGSKLYPEANVGILSPPAETEDAWMYDSPSFWSKENYTIKQIALLRTSLINSRFKANINDFTSQRIMSNALLKKYGINLTPTITIEEAQKKGFFDF